MPFLWFLKLFIQILPQQAVQYIRKFWESVSRLDFLKLFLMYYSFVIVIQAMVFFIKSIC